MSAVPSYMSPDAWKIVQSAKVIALADDADVLRPQHLFHACVVVSSETVRRFLRRVQVTDAQAQSLLSRFAAIPDSAPRTQCPPLILSPEARAIIERARQIADDESGAGGSEVTPAHLWISVIVEAPALSAWLGRHGWPDDLPGRIAAVAQAAVPPAVVEPLGPDAMAVLDRFCSRNLTRLARSGALDVAHGALAVRQQIASVLLKKDKRSVVLTGPAGVGKTKLVEDLSVAIVRNELPDLAGCSVYEFDLVQFTRGTHLVGSLAERWAELTQVLKANRDRVILFIDELHTIVGLPMGGSAMDLANALKPLMTDDTLRIVGATTTDEYRRYIEGDPALARRFSEVKVSEPDREGTLRILRKIAPAYEAHHGVLFSDEALDTIYEMATAYFPNRSFPAKGVDLLDEVGVHVRLRHSSIPATRAVVGPSDVRDTFKRVWGIEPQAVAVDLGALLKERVRGQDEAAERLADMIAVSRFQSDADLRGRPRASILFAGPPGVGKSHMARALSDILFPGRETLLTLDMTEFSGVHSAEHTRFRLLGPPPPYVGWENGGILTSHALQYPFSVVLVDELDKAASEARNIFLRILNDGGVQDGRGRLVSFRGMYFIFTANADSPLGDSACRRIGFDRRPRPEDDAAPSDGQAREALARQDFAPEFLSRISQIAMFRELDESDLAAIAAADLQRLADQALVRGGLLLQYDEALLTRWIVGQTPLPRDCRRVRAALERFVETPLAHWRIRRSGDEPVVITIAPRGDRVEVVADSEPSSIDARLLSRVHDVFERTARRERHQRAARAVYAGA